LKTFSPTAGSSATPTTAGKSISCEPKSENAPENNAPPDDEPKAKPANNGAVRRLSITHNSTVTSSVANGRITGYTRHGLNQAIGREGTGVSSRAILDAAKNPLEIIQQSGGRIKYIGKDAGVVVNQEGKIITTWPRGSGGLRRPGGGN
jgi:hypothetical protein